MAAPRDRRHLLVPIEHRSRRDYTRPPRRVTASPPPAPPSRKQHGQALRESFEQAIADAQERRAEVDVEVHGGNPGVYVEFESQPGVPLDLPTLEDKRKGIELVAVTERAEAEDRSVTTRATVFVPDQKTDHFTRRLDKYADDSPKKKREQRHEAMLDPVAEIRLATLRGLWTDSSEVYPGEREQIWWEVWLRRHDEAELERFTEYCHLLGLTVGDRRLQFDDRIVVLVRATPNELAGSMDVLQDIAEVRKAKEAVAFFFDLAPSEQAAWSADLRDRTTPPPPDAPAVSLLDTGVNRGHPKPRGRHR